MAYQATGVVYTDQDDKVRRYKARIDAAQSKLQEWHGNTETWLSYYRNKPRVYTRGGQKVRVPTAISSIDAMFSALTAVEVEIKLSPMGTTSQAQVQVAEEAVRNEWLAQKVQQEVEYATKDSLITGIGWVYVGYEFEEDEVEYDLDDDELRDEAMRRIEEADANGIEVDPEAMAAELPTTKTEREVVKERVYVEHVCYDDVVFDPQAKKWPDVRWVARRIVLPWEQVMESDEFDNTQDLTWDSTINVKWRSSKQNEPEDDEKFITLWEMIDFETGLICTLPDSGDRILREDPNPYADMLDYQDRSPLVPLVLRFNPGEVIGIGDIEAMKPSIDEQNVLRSSLATYVERNKPKLIAREGALTAAGKRAAKSQEWGDIVETVAGVVAQDVRAFELPSMPQEAFILDQRAAEDARNAIGLNELLQGILPVGKKTATGMNMLQNSSEIRQSERKNRQERFYTDIAQRMLVLMQKYYDETRVTRIVGEDEDVVWTWSAEDIHTLMTLEVSLQPKIAVDDQTLRENLMALKSMFSVDQSVDQAELNKYIMLQMKIPKDWIKRIQKTPEQAQAEAQGQLQTQAAQAQAEEGIPPDASLVPGPMDGGETLAVANPGEVPPSALDRLASPEVT